MFSADFTPLRHEHGYIYRSFFAKSKTLVADSFPNSRMAWNIGYHYAFREIAECLCLVSDGGIFCNPHVALPLGELDKTKLETIIESVMPNFEAANHHLRFMFVDEGYLPLFNSLDQYEIKISHNEDYSDYVYDADALRTLTGRTYRQKRNHINQFVRMYPDYVFEPITFADKRECVQLMQTWCEEKQINCVDPLESDCVPMTRLFDSMDVLDVRGGVIRVSGKVVAFALGSVSPDGEMAVIHFEKADPAIMGVYSVINQLVLTHIFPDVKLVNREEDMGIIGLRTAKESYAPSQKAHKYSVFVERKVVKNESSTSSTE